jgi:Ca2+-binding EF-hand superfamily protein
VFHQLDRNQDSVLSPRELSDLNRIALQDLDKNRNRKIDADEWPSGFAQFERLDTNNDGKIAANEYFERGGEWQRRQRFDSWDTNRDGIIQSTEWKTENGMFHRLDTDADSKVSWSEFSADKERYDRPYGWRQR